MSTPSEFSFIGGHPCLDFVNTLGGATKARDIDRLPTFRDAIQWARLAGLINAGEERALSSLARPHPTAAAEGTRHLHALRDAIYRVLEILSKKRDPGGDALCPVETFIKEAVNVSHLQTPKSKPGEWVVDLGEVGLDGIRHRVALAMASLLTSANRLDVRGCEACSWLFLDPTPTKRRRWCSMAACGNRAKARRHYHGSSSQS
jgi:predicted RNA-binding Zn ribbon-like protein